MSSATQQHRPIAIASPLGRDVLLFQRMSGNEQLGRLFEYRFNVLSEESNIDFSALLGQNITVRLDLANDKTRYFNGYVSECAQGLGPQERYDLYHLTVVPWLWFLTRSTDCKIFQELTVPQIIEEVFADYPMAKYELRLTKEYRQREYCVQYRESDFDFVNRLLQEEGIYFYFLHDNGEHKLILCDDKSASQPFPGYATIPFYPPDPQRHKFTEYIYDWRINHRVQPGRVMLNDFDFKVPKKALKSPSQNPRDHAQANFEVYDYPGEYTEPDDGEHYARVRLEELQTQDENSRGRGNARGLKCGALFTLEEFLRADQNREYLITGAVYEMHLDAYESGPDRNTLLYECSFTAIPSEQPFRPARTTRRPKMQGPQTAMVVGPGGEEIWTDEYGRVKCQFHWDRYGQADENSSCWIRVSQPWAGKHWGTIALPRIGQEVIVDFLEGDPDQPIVTGRVYNGISKPPYDLPDWKAYATTKTNSTKGGAGFNEIRFDDRKGKEQIFIHGQKRMDVRVRGSVYETCGGNRQIRVGVRSDDKPGGNLAVTVGGDTDIHIKQALYEGIDKKINQTVKEDVVCDYQAKDAVVVKDTYELNARQITLEALHQITFKVGSSFIKLDLTGITIQAPLVNINSGGSANGTGPVNIQDPLDAASADTGVPGYLDALAAAGAGSSGAGRRSRTLVGQHGPNVTRNDDGSYQVGNIRVNQGTDPDFQRNTLNDLATMGTTTEGQATLNSINSSGRNVTINERAPNPADPLNAETTATNGPNSTNGVGSDSTIDYDPRQWPASSTAPGNNTNAPSDVILHHELSHAEQIANGNDDFTPRSDCFDDQGEFNTIAADNRYRDERGVGRRTDHKDF